MIPPFPQLPLTMSATPSHVFVGESFMMRMGLKCMKQPVSDIAINIKLIKGEKEEDVWTYYG